MKTFSCLCAVQVCVRVLYLVHFMFMASKTNVQKNKRVYLLCLSLLVLWHNATLLFPVTILLLWLSISSNNVLKKLRNFDFFFKKKGSCSWFSAEENVKGTVNSDIQKAWLVWSSFPPIQCSGWAVSNLKQLRNAYHLCTVDVTNQPRYIYHCLLLQVCPWKKVVATFFLRKK